MKTLTHKMKQALLKGLGGACLLLAAPFAMQGVAQTDNGTPEVEVSSRLTYTQQFDLRYKAIPLRVPTGYLYDRVYPFAALNESGECDTTEPYDIYQGWSEIERSGLLPDLPQTYDAMRERVNLSLLGNVIPIIGFDVRMAEIDTLAVDQGRIIQIGETLTDAGLESPYNVFRAQRIGLAQTEFYSDVAYTFIFNPENFFSNTGAVVKRIAIHRPGMEVVWLNPNDPWTLTGLEGNEPWRIEAELENDPRKVCGISKVESVGPFTPKKLGNCIEGALWVIESDIPFKGDLEEFATTSLAGAHIYFRTTPTGQECRLHKPVIIVDGFDPLDQRNHIAIGRLLRYSKNFGLPEGNLLSDLRSKGYDVIILNFPVLGNSFNLAGRSDVKMYKKDGTFDKKINLPGRDGGADYIQRNAFLLVKLIQLVNNDLSLQGSKEKLVVVGPSMGGLISRYALAYMEKQESLRVPNMTHNVRLWMSFDAPHQGANIGLGTQHAVEYFGVIAGDEKSKSSYYNTLKSIAARQLLVFSKTPMTQKDTFNALSLHRSFYTDLRLNGLPFSDGYPQNVRKVSLLNGTLNGNRNFQPCDFDVNIVGGTAGLDFFKLIIRHAPEEGETCDVFECVMPERRKIFPNSIPPKLLENKGTVIHHNQRWFQDFLPGSYFVDKENLSGSIIEALKKEGLDEVSVFYDKINFTFISSASAIDLRPEESLPMDGDYSERRLNCEGKIPFDGYFAPDENQSHIFITEESAKWVLQEAEKGRSGCEPLCAVKKDWPKEMCFGEEKRFEITNLPQKSPYGIRWFSEKSALSVVSGHTASVSSLKADKETDNEYSNVEVVVNSHCGADLTLKGFVKIPVTKAEISGDDVICQGRTKTYALSSSSEMKNPVWYFQDNLGVYRFSSPYEGVQMPTSADPENPNNLNSVLFGGTRVGSYELVVEAENHCGGMVKAKKYVTIIPENHCTGKFTEDNIEQIHVYPNPVESNLTIQLNEGGIYKCTLRDIKGRIIKADTYDQTPLATNLLLKDLDVGSYILAVETSDGKTYFKKVIKSK